MDKAKHRQWGNKDMLFYCPQNKLVWQYDNIGNIHKYKDLPSYGLPRKELPQQIIVVLVMYADELNGS